MHVSRLHNIHCLEILLFLFRAQLIECPSRHLHRLANCSVIKHRLEDHVVFIAVAVAVAVVVVVVLSIEPNSPFQFFDKSAKTPRY